MTIPRPVPPGRVGKRALTERLAATTGLTPDQARTTAAAFLQVLADSVRAGRTLHLEGVGTFTVHPRAARTVLHPRTGAPLHVPAGRRVTFTPDQDPGDHPGGGAP